MQHSEVLPTAKGLFSFLKGGITWNYRGSRLAAKYYIEDGISREVGVKIASKTGNPLGWKYNVEVAEAFFDLVEKYPIEGLRSFDNLLERFPVGPRVWVPIKPLAVTREAGYFIPTFLVPWSSIAFAPYQASLFMTVLEKSLFRLTDFENSPGRIIFLPKTEVGPGEFVRRPVVWERGKFPLLTDKELNDQIRVFAESREIARVWYTDYLSKRGK
jgi:hypothetical protein